VLLKEPKLYAQYTREAAAGELFDLPVNKSDGGGEEDCAECSGTGTVSGRVCESCNGFGTVEPDADDEEKTEKAKAALIAKLESVDDLERRILKLEAGLKRR
jgi:RecJ-like exonuclease